MKLASVVSAVAACAAVASAMPQAASPAPQAFNITNVVAGGTGCPRGSIDVEWKDDKVLPICKLRLPAYLRDGELFRGGFRSLCLDTSTVAILIITRRLELPTSIVDNGLTNRCSLRQGLHRGCWP